MKKYLLSSIILTALLSGVASAETTATSVNRIGEIKQKIVDIKQKTAEEKAAIKARIASTTINIKNKKQELKNAIEIKIGKKLDAQKLKIINVFEKSIRNLKGLIARIESRMTKMEAKNINVSSSKILLETAREKVALAETELTNLANLLAQDISVSTSTTQNTKRKIALQNIKKQSKKTKSVIKAAHKSIVEVVVSLKAGLLKEKEATSTISTSTNNL